MRGASVQRFFIPTLLGICTFLTLAPNARAADTVADLEAQYQDALAILKKPPISGVLVTEVEPDSPASRAGVRAGDIITEYYGTRIPTLKVLREQLAEAMAHHLEDPNAGTHVVLRARRGATTVALNLTREPLGIRAIEIEVGVPGPRNPPASARGTIAFDWNQVMAFADDKAAFRTTTFTPAETPAAPLSPAAALAPASEDWIGWQILSTHSDGKDALTGSIDIHRIDAATQTADVDGPSTYTFHLRLGDFKSAPAFVLEEWNAQFPADDGATLRPAARRMGASMHVELRTGLTGPITTQDNPTPLTAIIQPAVPWVAAAMPHQPQAVLALHLLSIRDFLSRPGYVLATQGPQPLPADAGPAQAKPLEQAWRVDLLHCGVLVESYWFSDQRRLLAVQSQAVQPVISRRVADATIAASALQAKTPVPNIPSLLPKTPSP